MSIEASCRRVTPDEFTRLQGDARAAESFFGTSLEDLDEPEKLMARIQERETSVLTAKSLEPRSQPFRVLA